MLEADQRCECVITNISDHGAHINVADSKAFPDSFVLLLAENGATRRRCRVIWRKPREIGIKFDSWLDERIRAGVKPKLDARAGADENKEAEKV
jgi:PilZ domain-containing protein